MKQIKIDDLRKTGFSKEGKHRNPQIILGLLVSREGYPLAYCIHEGNKYEGHTMLSMIEKFVKEHQLQDFVVVADSKLMTESNLSELERLKCKYIIGVRLKNESKKITDWVLQQPKINQQMVESEKENGRKLLVGYTDDRAKKDAYNRQKELHRLEKLYVKGRITKDQINKKGYNKFLEINNSVEVTINYEKVAQDAAWDGLKGYITNTDLPKEMVYEAYHNLWQVERSFRIAKSKIEIKPIFHFTKKRIEAL